MIGAIAEEGALYERWQPIKTAPMGRNVLIAFKNESGKWRIVKAAYFTKYALEASSDFEGGEYDEERGEYYVPPGWYEDVEAETGLDYSYHSLGPIGPTHWMPLPEPPKEPAK